MKRLLLMGFMLGAVACASRPADTGASPTTAARGDATGAASPRAAVETFLNAVRAQDLQAMSVIWGTDKGPARDQMPRDELEKRELTMQCFLMHDSFRIVNDLPGTQGKRTLRVELTNASRNRETNFYAVRGPSDRWFVENVEIDPLKDFCRGP
ncbi:MAG: hypothetical protein M3373_02695 [Gemmatimonadota bacterium]|nr:hypothetical protein [Gemmatimonadota bacterium]